jgi:hypothetical protein
MAKKKTRVSYNKLEKAKQPTKSFFSNKKITSFGLKGPVSQKKPTLHEKIGYKPIKTAPKELWTNYNKLEKIQGSTKILPKKKITSFGLKGPVSQKKLTLHEKIGYKLINNGPTKQNKVVEPQLHTNPKLLVHQLLQKPGIVEKQKLVNDVKVVEKSTPEAKNTNQQYAIQKITPPANSLSKQTKVVQSPNPSYLKKIKDEAAARGAAYKEEIDHYKAEIAENSQLVARYKIMAQAAKDNDAKQEIKKSIKDTESLLNHNVSALNKFNSDAAEEQVGIDRVVASQIKRIVDKGYTGSIEFAKTLLHDLIFAVGLYTCNKENFGKWILSHLDSQNPIKYYESDITDAAFCVLGHTNDIFNGLTHAH